VEAFGSLFPASSSDALLINFIADIAARTTRAKDRRRAGKLVHGNSDLSSGFKPLMKVKEIIIGFCAIGAGILMRSLLRKQVLPAWSRNYFFKLSGLPEIFDRIIILICAATLIFIGSAILLHGVGLLK
jgi:hypothetical protein